MVAIKTFWGGKAMTRTKYLSFMNELGGRWGLFSPSNSSYCHSLCFKDNFKWTFDYFPLTLWFYKSLRSENTSLGSLHVFWQTQDVIHIIFHLKEPSLEQSNCTVITVDLLGMQHLLSRHIPQKVGLYLFLLVHPEKTNFSALGSWNVGWHVFPLGILKYKGIK